MSAEGIIHKYANIVKTEFTQYFDLIFEEKYEKKIFEYFLKKYVELRYLNISKETNTKTTFKDAIKAEFELDAEKLEQKYSAEKVENIKNIFIYLTEFDKLTTSKKTETAIQKIVDYRKEKLGFKKATFNRLFKQTLEEQATIKRNFINKYKSDDFDLKITALEKEKNIYKVEMKCNIQFSKLYSKEIIKQTFETGLTNEDRLFVEYNLSALQVLEDIIKEEFKKTYILDFAPILISKKAKFTRLLKIIETDYLKEKLILSINYTDFEKESKDELYKIMRQGYKFAIVLDNDLKLSEKDIGRLEIFSHILVSEKAKIYNQIIKIKNIADNLIEI